MMLVKSMTFSLYAHTQIIVKVFWTYEFRNLLALELNPLWSRDKFVERQLKNQPTVYVVLASTQIPHCACCRGIVHKQTSLLVSLIFIIIAALCQTKL